MKESIRKKSPEEPHIKRGWRCPLMGVKNRPLTKSLFSDRLATTYWFWIAPKLLGYFANGIGKPTGSPALREVGRDSPSIGGFETVLGSYSQPGPYPRAGSQVLLDCGIILQ